MCNDICHITFDSLTGCVESEVGGFAGCFLCSRDGILTRDNWMGDKDELQGPGRTGEVRRGEAVRID
jgi:hypothetical protein